MVEDHYGIRFGLKMLLELEGHEVSTADRGEDALELLSSATYDVVLLDLTTNGITAHEFTQTLRSRCRESGVSLPVVGILSGSSRIEQEATQLEADFFIRKPFDQTDVLEKLHPVMQLPVGAVQQLSH